MQKLQIHICRCFANFVQIGVKQTLLKLFLQISCKVMANFLQIGLHVFCISTVAIKMDLHFFVFFCILIFGVHLSVAFVLYFFSNKSFTIFHKEAAARPRNTSDS